MEKIKEMLMKLLGEGGEISAMRFMSISATLTACSIAAYAVYADKDLINTAALVTSLLMPAFGGKALQKISEGKKDV